MCFGKIFRRGGRLSRIQRNLRYLSRSQLETIKLESHDGQIFEITLKSAFCSKAILNSLLESDELGRNNSSKGQIFFKVADVEGNILQKVLEWMNYNESHIDGRRISAADSWNSGCSNGENGFSAWETNFVMMNNMTLFKVWEAAEILGIEGLRRLVITACYNKLVGWYLRDNSASGFQHVTQLGSTI